KRFPDFSPLYRAMLRILMPRWGGSYEDIDQLIVSVTRLPEAERDPALYARLYWIYSSMEQDQINIFSAGKADWPTVQSGFLILRRRYPDSDIILNGFAKVACIASDREQYAQLRPLVAKRMSSEAWSQDVSLAGCDKSLLKAIER